MFSTELLAGTIEATGTVDFDDMGNTIVTITVAGKTLSESELTSKEFEVLKRFFAKEYA
jgi:hypothetical protein